MMGCLQYNTFAHIKDFLSLNYYPTPFLNQDLSSSIYPAQQELLANVWLITDLHRPHIWELGKNSG